MLVDSTLLINHQPPSSTLFPYTTLFRSVALMVPAQLEAHARAGDVLHPLAGEGVAHVVDRSEEHTSELQSQFHLVCRLLLEKKNTTTPPSRPLPILRRHAAFSCTIGQSC